MNRKTVNITPIKTVNIRPIIATIFRPKLLVTNPIVKPHTNKIKTKIKNSFKEKFLWKKDNSAQQIFL